MESEVKPGENLKVKIKIADVEFSAEGDKDFCDRNLKEFIESLETIFKANRTTALLASMVERGEKLEQENVEMKQLLLEAVEVQGLQARYTF